MQYKLIDASSMLYCFDKTKDGEKRAMLLDEIGKKEDFFYIPQFCVTEVFATINKWYLRKSADGTSKISPEEANKLSAIFSYMIHERRYLYVYELNKYHTLNCSKIFPVESSTPKSNRAYLSTFDILIIAMGCELQMIHSKENFSIISSDKRLVDVSNAAGINAELF